MISVEVARTIVGIIGNIICLFFYLSPAPTFVKIWKKGSVEQYSAYPYLASLLSCLAWTLYSLPMVHPGSTLVLTVSVFGITIQSTFILLFFIFSNDNKQRLKVLLVLLAELTFMALLAFFSITFVHTHAKRTMIVGVVCICLTVLMYSSPLAIMKLVIETKSVEYMPLFLSFASFATSVVWTFYALLKFDLFLVVPNGLGALFGLAQLILHAVYYKSTKQLVAAKKGKELVDLSDVVVAGEELKKIVTVAPDQINGHDHSENHMMKS